MTNEQLEKVVDTSDDWISQRTGIKQRHLLAPGEGLSDIAALAAERALASAGMDPSEIDLVVMATSTPDDMFGDAAGVANTIGATSAVAFDLTAACSGFLFALNSASHFLHAGSYRTALVLGGDAMSRWVDWEDRNTCVLFGDGAGAVVLRATDSAVWANDPPGILGFAMRSNGAGRSELKCSCEYDSEHAKKELADVRTPRRSTPQDAPPSAHPHLCFGALAWPRVRSSPPVCTR